MTRVVVLVEGESDAVVVRSVLAAAGPDDQRGPPTVVAMGGVTNAGHHARRLAREEPRAVVLGLCDAGERRYLERAAPPLAQVFVCDRDLEEELVRALGEGRVLDVLAGLGELERFRTFQGQPEWRGRPVADQLRRFAGTRSGRKAVLAHALAAELAPGEVPAPLASLAAAVQAARP